MTETPVPEDAVSGPCDCDPVGMTEVAEMFGISIKSVIQWQTRKNLPPRDFTVGGRPAWHRATILAWGERTGRLPLAVAEPEPAS